MVEFDEKRRTKAKEGQVNKRNAFDSVSALYEGGKLTLDTFKVEYLY